MYVTIVTILFEKFEDTIIYVTDHCRDKSHFRKLKLK